MSRTALLTAIVLLALAAPAAAQTFSADISFAESFDSLAGAEETNNVTIGNGEIRPLDEDLNWDVDNETLINSTDIPDVGNSPGNLEWGRNGTRLYILSNSEIYQYNVDDPHNASNATFALSTSVSGDVKGLEFSPDGNYLLTVDVSGSPNVVERYSMGTNWQIAPLSLDSTRDVPNAVDPTDIQASPGGSSIYLFGDSIRRYAANESVPWFPDTSEESSTAIDPATAEFEGNNTYLNFSGLNSGDYVEVQDSGMTELDVTGDVTIAFRAHVYQPLDQNADNNFRHAVGKSPSVGQYAVVLEEGGTIDFSVFKGGSRERARGCNFPVGSNFTVAATHDTSTGESRIYLNGTECASATVATGSLDTDNDNFFIGSSTGGRQLPGQVDDVLLDASFYSDSDATAYHNGSGTPTDARLSLNFSSGIGTTAVDGAGTRNDGTINNPDWESGLFGPAGDTLIVQKTNRTMFELTADDYRISSTSVVDSDDSPELENTSLNGMAWDLDGDEVATIDTHRGDLAIETYDGGFEPNPYAQYVYDAESPVQATKLKWEIINQSSGDVNMLVGVRNGPDGSQTLERVGPHTGDREDVWTATSSDWTHVVVRVEPRWDGESRWAPAIDQFGASADLVEEIEDVTALPLATLLVLLLLIGILVAFATALESALFATLAAIGVVMLALTAAGILAASTAAIVTVLALTAGSIALILAWRTV